MKLGIKKQKRQLEIKTIYFLEIRDLDVMRFYEIVTIIYW